MSPGHTCTALSSLDKTGLGTTSCLYDMQTHMMVAASGAHLIMATSSVRTGIPIATSLSASYLEFTVHAK